MAEMPEATCDAQLAAARQKLRAFDGIVARTEPKSFAGELGPFHEENGAEKTITAAQNAVKGSLKDPDSATFQNLRIVDFNGGKVVCGEVNAKNAYGGYVGYTAFVAGISAASLYSSSSRYPDVNNASNAGLIMACGG